MAEKGSVIGCHTIAQWNRQLQLASESGKLVVVDFTSSWCGPCRMIAPFFAELANKFTDAIFLRVDVNELKRVALDCAIETLPTFIFLRQGNIVDRVVGARKDMLPKKIELHMRN
ncbi:unnamed protein product [Musa acuminata subsp. burmannicoides]